MWTDLISFSRCAVQSAKLWYDGSHLLLFLSVITCPGWRNLHVIQRNTTLHMFNMIGTSQWIKRAFGLICRLQALRLLQKLHRTGLFADVRGDKYDAEMFIDSRSRLYRFVDYIVIPSVIFVLVVYILYFFYLYCAIDLYVIGFLFD